MPVAVVAVECSTRFLSGWKAIQARAVDDEKVDVAVVVVVEGRQAAGGAFDNVVFFGAAGKGHQVDAGLAGDVDKLRMGLGVGAEDA